MGEVRDPFLGFSGRGARAEFRTGRNGVILRETTRTQLNIIFLMAAAGPGLTAILWIGREDLRTRPMVFSLVALGFAAISWLAMIRRISRLAGARRIELDGRAHAIRLVPARARAPVIIPPDEVATVEVVEGQFVDDSGSVPNFTVILRRHDLTEIELFTTDDPANAAATAERIRAYAKRG